MVILSDIAVLFLMGSSAPLNYWRLNLCGDLFLKREYKTVIFHSGVFYQSLACQNTFCLPCLCYIIPYQLNLEHHVL